MVLIDDNSKVLKIGDFMPPFRIHATQGMVDTHEIKEPVLVVVFTCNHCPYAQAVEPQLIELGREFLGKGAAFILICSNDAMKFPDDSFEEMRNRAKEKGYPFPYAHDETQDVAKAFGALCTPHCFVFDQDRKLRYKGRVDDNWPAGRSRQSQPPLTSDELRLAAFGEGRKEPEKVKERNLRDAIEALLEGKNPPKEEANAIGCSIKWKA